MKLIPVVSLLILSFSANASMKTASEVKYSGDSDYFGICEAIVKNDLDLFKVNLNKKVGSVATSRKRVLQRMMAKDGVSCNGANLISFSKQREADNVHAFLSEFAD